MLKSESQKSTIYIKILRINFCNDFEHELSLASMAKYIFKKLPVNILERIDNAWEQPQKALDKSALFNNQSHNMFAKNIYLEYRQKIHIKYGTLNFFMYIVYL